MHACALEASVGPDHVRLRRRACVLQVHAHVEWKLHAVKNMRSVTIARLEEARAALAAQHAELRGLKASRDRCWQSVAARIAA